MKRFCPYFLVLLFASNTATAADPSVAIEAIRAATESPVERRISNIENMLARFAQRYVDEKYPASKPRPKTAADYPPRPKLSVPVVTYGMVKKKRQVFAGYQRQCQIINGRRHCFDVPTYRTESYEEWGPIASSQHVVTDEALQTPMQDVAKGLKLLNIQPHETLVEFGCGVDARYAITALDYYKVGRAAIAIEIDPERAASARQYVARHNLTGRLQVIDGDATTISVQADVGIAYLYPEVLAKMVPQIKKLKRFVSYRHAVPGLAGQVKHGNFYLWTKPQPVTYQSAAPRRYAVWRGQVHYQDYNSGCSCPMCDSIRFQLGIR